jgi:hypothetical protein
MQDDGCRNGPDFYIRHPTFSIQAAFFSSLPVKPEQAAGAAGRSSSEFGLRNSLRLQCPSMPVVGSEARITVPADLQEVIDALATVEHDAERIVTPLDDEQFNWSPARGSWSIAQCLDHLNAANGRYFGAVTEAVARAQASRLRRREPIQPSLVGRWFIAALEPPVGLKMRAPRYIRPARRRHKAEVWPEFVRQHTHMRASIAGWGHVDLNRAVFPNPLGRYGRVRAGTALRIIAAHDRRHVWQASRVRATDGFPRS